MQQRPATPLPVYSYTKPVEVPVVTTGIIMATLLFGIAGVLWAMHMAGKERRAAAAQATTAAPHLPDEEEIPAVTEVPGDVIPAAAAAPAAMELAA